MSSQQQTSDGGCCTYPRGFKCTIIWIIALSCVGLLMAVIAGSFWSWATGIVAVAVNSAMACATPAKTLAIVGGVFCLISFLLMAIAAIVTGVDGDCLYYDDTCTLYYDYYSGYYVSCDDDDFNPCHGLAIVAGLGSLVWIPPGIICIHLACKLGGPDDDDNKGQQGEAVHAKAVAVDTEKGEDDGGAPAAEEQPYTSKEGGGHRIEETPSNRRTTNPKIVASGKVKNIPAEPDIYVERDT